MEVRTSEAESGRERAEKALREDQKALREDQRRAAAAEARAEELEQQHAHAVVIVHVERRDHPLLVGRPAARGKRARTSAAGRARVAAANELGGEAERPSRLFHRHDVGRQNAAVVVRRWIL